MSIRFFNSENVKIFPCARRGLKDNSIFDAESRFTTEANLASLSGIAFNRESYIIEKGDDIKPWRLVIKGYYFEITEAITESEAYFIIGIEATEGVPSKRLGALTYGEISNSLSIGGSSLDLADDSGSYKCVAIGVASTSLTSFTLSESNNVAAFYELSIADTLAAINATYATVVSSEAYTNKEISGLGASLRGGTVNNDTTPATIEGAKLYAAAKATAAQSVAEAKAAELDGVLKTELQAEIDSDVEAAITAEVERANNAYDATGSAAAAQSAAIAEAGRLDATLKTAIEGTANDESKDATIAGAKKYAEEKAEDAKTAAQDAAKSYADTRTAELRTEIGQPSTLNGEETQEATGLYKTIEAAAENALADAKKHTDTEVTNLLGVTGKDEETIRGNRTAIEALQVLVGNGDTELLAQIEDIQGKLENLAGIMRYRGCVESIDAASNKTDLQSGDVFTLTKSIVVGEGENQKEYPSGSEIVYIVENDIPSWEYLGAMFDISSFESDISSLSGEVAEMKSQIPTDYVTSDQLNDYVTTTALDGHLGSGESAERSGIYGDLKNLEEQLTSLADQCVKNSDLDGLGIYAIGFDVTEDVGYEAEALEALKTQIAAPVVCIPGYSTLPTLMEGFGWFNGEASITDTKSVDCNMVLKLKAISDPEPVPEPET